MQNIIECLKSPLILAWSPTIVAVTTATIYWATLRDMRTHNRLSVTPNLQVRKDHKWDDKGGRLEVLIENCGIGPAIVRKMSYSVRGSSIEMKHEAVHLLASKYLASIGRYEVIRSYELDGEVVIPVGRTICVAEVFFPELPEPRTKEIDSCLSDIKIAGNYESFYGTKFKI